MKTRGQAICVLVWTNADLLQPVSLLMMYMTPAPALSCCEQRYFCRDATLSLVHLQCLSSLLGPIETISGVADHRILSAWTETDSRTDSLHQSDAPLGLTWCS